jgi:hypothetical protein
MKLGYVGRPVAFSLPFNLRGQESRRHINFVQREAAAAEVKSLDVLSRFRQVARLNP